MVSPFEFASAARILFGVGAIHQLAGLAAARRLSTNARLARTLFAWLILVVAAYVAWRALGG